LNRVEQKRVEQKVPIFEEFKKKYDKRQTKKKAPIPKWLKA